MTGNPNNSRPYISTLETKPSNQARPPTPRPEPINGNSENSHD